MSGSGKMDLYFYTHLESKEHCDRVMQLLNGKLLLSDPHGFNDPFDSKLRFRHAITDAEAQTELKKQGGLWSRITPNPSFAKNSIENQREMICSQYRMFCFSEKWDSLLMWAHYARSHQGVCLKLRLDLSDLPNPGDWFEPVRYSKHYPDIYGEDVKAKDEQALRTLFLTKSVDWLYEKEWRYITRYNDCEHNKIIKAECVHFPNLEVSAVYLGVRFNELKMLREVQCCLSQQMESEINSAGEAGQITDNEGHNRVVNKYSAQQKDVFQWIESDDQKALKHFFGNESWGANRECVFREQVLMKIQQQRIPMFKCRKQKGRFAVELDAYQHDPLRSTDALFFGVGATVVEGSES